MQLSRSSLKKHFFQWSSCSSGAERRTGETRWPGSWKKEKRARRSAVVGDLSKLLYLPTPPGGGRSYPSEECVVGRYLHYLLRGSVDYASRSSCLQRWKGARPGISSSWSWSSAPRSSPHSLRASTNGASQWRSSSPSSSALYYYFSSSFVFTYSFSTRLDVVVVSLAMFFETERAPNEPPTPPTKSFRMLRCVFLFFFPATSSSYYYSLSVFVVVVASLFMAWGLSIAVFIHFCCRRRMTFLLRVRSASL